MNCLEINNKIFDFVDGTLTSEEENIIKLHISQCDSCKKLLDETKRIVLLSEDIPKAQPSYNLKQSFELMLASEKQLQEKVITIANKNKFSWRTPLQIAASIMLLISGYFMGSYTVNQKTQKEIVLLQKEGQQLKENMMLAMIDNRSAIKRIKAVNYSEDLVEPEQRILNALIERLEFDSNINVRLAAAQALSNFSESELVRNTLIKALTTEENPIVQIEIIQVLVKLQEKNALEAMQKLLEQPEIPEYVKEQLNIGIADLI